MCTGRRERRSHPYGVGGAGLRIDRRRYNVSITFDETHDDTFDFCLLRDAGVRRRDALLLGTDTERRDRHMLHGSLADVRVPV